MSQPVLPPFASSAPLQAGLYYARKNRRLRLAQQIANNITYSASTPNPDVESGTEGNGENN